MALIPRLSMERHSMGWPAAAGTGNCRGVRETVIEDGRWTGTANLRFRPVQQGSVGGNISAAGQLRVLFTVTVIGHRSGAKVARRALLFFLQARAGFCVTLSVQ
ncbi:MAG: hypothetical protein QOF48_80 [Verrucomicrobiota bacterium]